MKKVILLDIDGVMVTTPAWRRPEFLADGFMKFDERAAQHLSAIIHLTGADIILTSTHRKSYTADVWKNILADRGISVSGFHLLDHYGDYSNCRTRCAEVEQWIKDHGQNVNYVIVDDDRSLEDLAPEYKSRWAKTMPLMGLNDETANTALSILNITR